MRVTSGYTPSDYKRNKERIAKLYNSPIIHIFYSIPYKKLETEC
jgi:hypothetical protein